MKVNKLNTESGRTMVEMLGVLAIIGVLSVISIYGYNQAMTKMKANEIANFASMFYAQAIATNGGDCTPNITNAQLGMTAEGLAKDLTVQLTSCPGNGTLGTVKINNCPDTKACLAASHMGGSNAFTISYTEAGGANDGNNAGEGGGAGGGE